MNTPKIKFLVMWNVVLTTLLLVTFAFVALSAQAANDPPVQIFTATLDHGNGVAGTGTTSNKTIDSINYLPILTVNVNFTGQSHVHHCIVMGSANVINPASGVTGKRYDFTVSQDGTPSSMALMTLEMSDNATIDDPNYVPVTTTRFLGSLSAAPHSFSFVARKQVSANPNLVIDNATFTVLCFKTLQAAVSMEEEPVEQEILPNDK